MKENSLQHFIKLVPFLGSMLGPDYEIVLYDLTADPPSVIAIANQHVSGRDIGAPLTNRAMQLIADKTYKRQDWDLNYRGQAENGKVLRCSTFFIKDDDGEPIGLLCINFDDSRYRDLSERIFALCHPDEYATQNISINAAPLKSAAEDNEQESFYNSISSAIDDALITVMNSSQVPVERLTQDEKVKILQLLEERGIFMLKGVIPIVAQKLASSPASIYRYLNKIKLEGRPKSS